VLRNRPLQDRNLLISTTRRSFGYTQGFEAVAVDTGDLAQVLRDVIGEPVEDHARLPMLFDGVVNWNLNRLSGGSRDQSFSAEPQPSDDDSDILTARREQLGLKLDRQRGPVETRIVEFAKLPSSDGRATPMADSVLPVYSGDRAIRFFRAVSSRRTGGAGPAAVSSR
jgi:uncharacterized protein (TIGR03435 family)